ncbi:MAG: YggS family pyridoxal phosphate-dependent enzyme [Myxococcales bacterium]|nr:YggS family pyridoxal phosphate-dependent enzyme [Myxococcales bacterium]
MIAEGLAAVKARIAVACARAGRDPGSVTLVAVSKLKPLADIEEAIAAGHRVFGENYAQELRDKAAALAHVPDVEWHAIGPLQTNKAKYVAKVASAFHALDRLEVAEALGARRQQPLDCYLEVNVADEATKIGVPLAEVGRLYEQVRSVAGIRVVGLMTMPPMIAPEACRPHFRAVREAAHALGLSGLSMGTTEDFEVAIEEGATVVRIGRSIFGARVA